MDQRDRAIFLPWIVAAGMAAGAWPLTRGPIHAASELVIGLALPTLAGRASRVSPPRIRTAATLSAAIVAVAIAVVGASVFPSGWGPRPLWMIPGMLGAAIGYWWERARSVDRSGATTGDRRPETEILRRRVMRLLAIGGTLAVLAGYCIWRESGIDAGDVAAEWAIRAFLAGIGSASSLVGAFLGAARLSWARRATIPHPDGPTQ